MSAHWWSSRRQRPTASMQRSSIISSHCPFTKAQHLQLRLRSRAGPDPPTTSCCESIHTYRSSLHSSWTGDLPSASRVEPLLVLTGAEVPLMF